MSPAPADGQVDEVLAALARRQVIEAPVALVVAHPDDETIGAGVLLRRFRRLTLVHVTDGAPRDLRDVHAAGFSSCATYAAARRAELRSAMMLAGAGAASRVELGLPDQEASLHLGWLARELSRRLRGMAAVLTHPYEGGHPDHDAVAFAVQQTGVPTIEMAGYHAAPGGGIRCGRFLPSDAAGREVVLTLDASERMLRDAMLGCFVTQHATLAPFLALQDQRFRKAPGYDFTRPPAERIYYDGFNWNMTSARWRELVADTARC